MPLPFADRETTTDRSIESSSIIFLVKAPFPNIFFVFQFKKNQIGTAEVINEGKQRIDGTNRRKQHRNETLEMIETTEKADTKAQT